MFWPRMKNVCFKEEDFSYPYSESMEVLSTM